MKRQRYVSQTRPSRSAVRHHRDSDRARTGFTLIELLLVMAILATLAVIVIPKFAGRSEQARVTATMTGIARVETALDAFEVDCGRYPTEQEGLTALVEVPADLDNPDLWKGPYLKDRAPKDGWGRPFVYNQPGRHNTHGVDIYSAGPNGQDGDGDDICNWPED
jgi:general secretion pathway protein G